MIGPFVASAMMSGVNTMLAYKLGDTDVDETINLFFIGYLGLFILLEIGEL
jgi:hypothetical protein